MSRQRAPRAAATFVFLHEGLGSVAMWRDFPQRLCDAAGARGIVLLASGYGRSTPRAAKRALGSGLHAPPGARGAASAARRAAVDRQARPPWLIGHSDGGSIALLHAARFTQASVGRWW